MGSEWLGTTFRPRHKHEDIDTFNQHLFEFKVNRLKLDPYFYINNVFDTIDAVSKNTNFVIDGITNPKDFIHLFDYNVDVAIFLNRTDMNGESKDYDGIAINIIRDYCLYLATVNLLPKFRWLEYNYKFLAKR